MQGISTIPKLIPLLVGRKRTLGNETPKCYLDLHPPEPWGSLLSPQLFPLGLCVLRLNLTGLVRVPRMEPLG